MNVVELINKKKAKKILTRQEIDFLVLGYTEGRIPDYQFSAFLMAVRLNGMTLNETVDLTASMIDTGERLDLSSLTKPKIDKHSTGGVGDKISLILTPLIAACGVLVPMISGRSLGHTGGTIDKLESIPGFRTDLNLKEMVRALDKVGCFISGQTETIVPADRKIYALRDVTGTVDSIPLITASIMSKKIAEGIDGLVLDVKCGKGAFMKKIEDARMLARWMKRTGERLGKVVSAIITNMDQPIGRMVGNGLEVWEAIKTLRNRGEVDVNEIVFTLGSEMLLQAGRVKNRQEGKFLSMSMIESGKAWEKFKEMVEFQGGNPDHLNDKNNFIKARYQYKIRASRSGFISMVDASDLGWAGLEIGVGRKILTDRIDPDAGFEILKKVGDSVERGEILIIVHTNRQVLPDFLKRVAQSFKIVSKRVKRPPLILGRI